MKPAPPIIIKIQIKMKHFRENKIVYSAVHKKKSELLDDDALEQFEEPLPCPPLQFLQIQ
jgi:hypothetical protein